MDRDEISTLYRGLPIYASYQVSVSQEKIFKKSTNQKQELSVVAFFDNGSGRNMQSLESTCHRCFLLSFGSSGQVVSEENIIFKSANQKQELPMVAMFVNRSELNEQS